jgi:hypothetical protein
MLAHLLHDKDTPPDGHLRESLSQAMAVAANRCIDGAATRDQLLDAAGLLHSIESARLHELDLSPDQAREARSQLGRALAIQMIWDDWWRREHAADAALAKATRLVSSPLLWLLLLPLPWLVLMVVSSPWPRSRVVKVVRMVSPIIVLCWLTILVAAHIVIGKWVQLRIASADPLSLYRPLPQATQKTYDRAIAALCARWREHGEIGIPDFATPDEATALIEECHASDKPLSDKHLVRLLSIAGAMAFISQPQETAARLNRLMIPMTQRYGTDLAHAFGRSLRGLPKSNATALLKEYVRRTNLEGHFITSDFATILTRAGDRDLAERVFRLVVRSPPTHVSYEWYFAHPANKQYLEAILPHLGRESVPVAVGGHRLRQRAGACVHRVGVERPRLHLAGRAA